MKCDFCGCKLTDDNEQEVVIHGNKELQFSLNLCEDCFDQKYSQFECEEI
jgi:hypothetical protein